MKITIGFFELLTILFIGLKLGHVIDWSWWWVLLPTYWWMIILLCAIIAVGLVDFIDGIRSNYKEEIKKAAKDYNKSIKKESKWQTRLKQLHEDTYIK